MRARSTLDWSQSNNISCLKYCLLFNVSASTLLARDLSSSIVVRVYAGAPYGIVICKVTSSHLFPAVDRNLRRVVVTGNDAWRFRLIDAGQLLTVGQYPALSGRIGDEYNVSVTSLRDVSETTQVVKLRVIVSRENMSPPRFIRTSPVLLASDDTSYFADSYRYDVPGTPLRMRQTISISDDDDDDADYNRVVAFSLHRRAGKGRQWRNRDTKYLSIDRVTGQLSIGQDLRAAPSTRLRVDVVATNYVASPPLASSIDVTVYVCDLPGKSRNELKCCQYAFRSSVCLAVC